MSRQTITVGESGILARIEKSVRAAEPGATVLLYGSRARGDARPDSDWDVLVLLDGPVDAGRRQAIDDALLDLFGETAAVVEPIVLSRKDWNSPHWRVLPFHQNVDTDGIALTPNGHEVPTVTVEEMAGAREDLIHTWLEQARESLDDAEYAASGGRWKNAVGRLYYALFYAVTALLVSRGYCFSSHHGVETLFNRHFGETGIAPADLVALYNDLHKNRLLADYSGTARFDEGQVQPWILETRRFLVFIEQLVQRPAEEK